MKFVIVGAGVVGLGVAEKLADNDHEVVLIEKDDAAIQRIPASLDIRVLRGNACSVQLLLDANIKDADYVIAASNSDEVNISVCLLSKILNPATKRIARIHDIDFEKYGINESDLAHYFDLIIDPDQAGAEYLLRLIRANGARDIVEFADGKLVVLGLEIKASSKLNGKRLAALKGNIPEFPFLILAVMRGKNMIIPRGKDKLKEGDLVYIITISKKIDLAFELTGRKLATPKYVVVWGGSNLSLSVADILEATAIQTKLIIADEELGMELADRYKRILVLSGDCSDMQLLVQENIAEADIFIAATDDEESNILSSILAKKLGAKSSMVMINKNEYLSLLPTLGIDSLVNSHIAAASAIFRYIHAGSVLSELSLEQTNAGFVEFEVPLKSDLLGKQIKDIGFPNGVLIAAIERAGDVIIPQGEEQILENDVLVLFLQKSEMRKLGKMLRIKFGMQE